MSARSTGENAAHEGPQTASEAVRQILRKREARHSRPAQRPRNVLTMVNLLHLLFGRKSARSTGENAAHEGPQTASEAVRQVLRKREARHSRPAQRPRNVLTMVNLLHLLFGRKSARSTGENAAHEGPQTASEAVRQILRKREARHSRPAQRPRNVLTMVNLLHLLFGRKSARSTGENAAHEGPQTASEAVRQILRKREARHSRPAQRPRNVLTMVNLLHLLFGRKSARSTGENAAHEGPQTASEAVRQILRKREARHSRPAQRPRNVLTMVNLLHLLFGRKSARSTGENAAHEGPQTASEAVRQILRKREARHSRPAQRPRNVLTMVNLLHLLFGRKSA